MKRFLFFVFLSSFLFLFFDFYVFAADNSFSSEFTLRSAYSVNTNERVSNSNPVHVVSVGKLYSPTIGDIHDFPSLNDSTLTYEYYGVYDVSVPFYYTSTNAGDMPQFGYYSFFSDFLYMFCTVSSSNQSDLKNFPLYFSHCYIEGSDLSVVINSTGNTQPGTVVPVGSNAQARFNLSFSDLPLVKSSPSSSFVFFTPFNFHFVFYTLMGSSYGNSLNYFAHGPLDFDVYTYTNTFILTDDNLMSSSSVAGQLQDINDTLIDQRNEDRDSASSAGQSSDSFVSQTTDLKNKWSILWYPIEFSNSILNVFTSGSASTVYSYKYYNVLGYSYDDLSGCLVPIRDPVMTISSPRVNSGSASITFPEYTLPVLDLKLWDSYTFDLSSLKEDFPALFDALYVFISILETYWFVSFLRSKFSEVFD